MATKCKVNFRALDLTIELMGTRIKCNKQNWQEVHLRSPHNCTCFLHIIHTHTHYHQPFPRNTYLKFTQNFPLPISYFMQLPKKLRQRRQGGRFCFFFGT